MYLSVINNYLKYLAMQTYHFALSLRLFGRAYATFLHKPNASMNSFPKQL